jgi:hypothetical protein
VERLDDFDDQLDDAGGREELAALLSLRHGELTEEVFIDLAEGVSLNRHRNGREIFQKGHQKAFLQTVVGLGKNVLEVFVLDLNRFHGIVDGLTYIYALWQIQQGSEPSFFG